MLQNKFTEEDKKKVVEFLNLIAKHARFNLNTNELIDYFKALAHMQKTILPKIEANIFEILETPQSQETEESEESKD